MKQSKIAITTDSNSGLSLDEWKEKDVFVLPMPFLIGGEPYLENVNLSQDDFYQLLATKIGVSTSQPSIGDLSDFWTEILKEFDTIVHVPMSSGLSQSCATAQTLAKEFDGRVLVVDNHRISVTLKESISDAIQLRDNGKTAEEIKTYLENTGADSAIYIAVDTMTYLKRGGRVTGAAAMIGSLLRIKPVLEIRGEKLDKYMLARSMQKAKEAMKSAIKNHLEGEFAEYMKIGKMCISVAHTQNAEEAEIFCAELQKAFPNAPIHYCDPLSLSVSCHIGPGALAVTCTRTL